MSNAELDFFIYIFNHRYQFKLSQKTTPRDLERFVFENFRETLPFFVSHATRLTMNFKNIMLTPSEPICKLCPGVQKVLIKVEFVLMHQKQASVQESSFLAEIDTLPSEEIQN